MKKVAILSIIAVVIFSGCTEKPKTEIQTETGNVTVSQEGGMGPGWCKAGATTTITSAGASGQMSYMIKGITSYKGKQVCEAEGKVTGEAQGVGSWTYYYSQDGSYAVMVMKDSSGNVLNEVNVKNP